MTVRALFAICLLIAAASLAPRAQAAITCEVQSLPTLAYGVIDLPVTDATTASTFARVQCTGSANGDRGAQVHVCVGLQTPSSPRQMRNGVHQVTHRLYRNAGRTEEIDYTNVNADLVVTLPSAGNRPFVAAPVDVPIYGKLQGSSTAPAPGTYSETVTGDMGWGAATTPCANVTASRAVAFTSTTTVRSNCTIATNPLDFGTVNVLTANVDTTTSLGLNCTNGAPWTIRMNGGTVASNVAARRMGVGGAGPGVIDYQLRHGSANGALWGDGTAGTTVLTGTGTGSSQTVTVYGRIPGGQPPPPVGTYSDVVTVSVEY